MANPAIERREGHAERFHVENGRTRLSFGKHLQLDWLFAENEAAIPGSGAVFGELSLLDALLARNSLTAFGVRLLPGDDVQALAPHLARLSLVELAFPKYRDGRHYSNARILRDQLGYAGEIRAAGDVLADQLFFMLRCGIDTLELHPSVKPVTAQAALARFAHVYLSASDTREPVWKQRI